MSALAILAAIPTRWKAIAAALLLVPLIFALGRCDGIRAEKARQKAQDEREALAATQRAREADKALSERRSAADAAIRANRKEYDDAVADLPDGALSERQRAAACRELRRTDPKAAATACGPARAPGAAGNAR